MANPGETVRFRFGLAIAAVLLGLFSVPMVRGQVLISDDLGYYCLPLRSFFAECLATGEDPSWCPNLFGGFYLRGEGQGIAHPCVRFLYARLPLNLAQNLEILWTYPALLAGFALLLGRWGVRRDAAVFGALVFAFGGYNFLHYVHTSVMGLLAHLPWLLLAIDVAMRSANPRQVALARIVVSLLTASQLLIGHVQFAWISVLGEASYAIFLACRIPDSGRRLFALVVSKGLGILGGSIQLLPTWEAFRDSKRERPTLTYVSMGSLPPLNLIQWVAPYLSVSRVVTPPMAMDDGVLAPAPSMYDWRVKEFAVYYGAAIPALLTWLTIRRKALRELRPLAVFAVAMAVGSLVLALGDYTPLFRLTTKVPVVGTFRISARYLVLFHLALAMLAALAFSALSEPSAREERASWRRLWPLALPVAASILACLAPRLPEGVWPSYLRDPYIASTPFVLAGPLLIGLGSALVALAARGSRAALIGLLAFAAADQAAYGFQMVALNAPMDLAKFVGERPFPPGAEVGSRVKFDRLFMIWQNQYSMRRLRLVQGYVSLMPRQLLSYDKPSCLRVAGVDWIMPGADEHGQPWFHAPWTALPRARLVTRTQLSSDPGRDIDAIEIETTALTDRLVSLPTAEPGQARIGNDRPGKIDVVTEAGSRQLLVVSESYHTGWQASVDGRRVPVVRVNGDFMGCVVPEGSHRIKLRFRPQGQRIGACLSVLGLVLMTAVPALTLLPRRTRPVAMLHLRGPKRPRIRVREAADRLKAGARNREP
jgi:hypothetical protein